MSIFRETFPAFIQTELGRRQNGMATRNPAFLHQLNSRSAWVRMTSGVDYEGSSDLAKKYVMQGGVLNYSTKETKDNGIVDVFTQKNGLGNASNAYSNLSQGGAKNRTGIRPMPGITNVNIQSKGAYGSLQEATVTFTCWDIRQLEELELLYMRPGYTVLLEFGWDFARAGGVLPNYDILNKEDITLNDAFAEIYELIDQSGGTYDALLGYVKNYNWSARDDGGYDCSTSIISLGEVLESLKCNWVPGETKAFDNAGKGILQITGNSDKQVLESYEKGIIPGLIQELWNSADRYAGGSTDVIVDKNTGNKYYLYKLAIKDDKNERGGLQKPLGGPSSKSEIYITLGSFCDLLSTYVFPKGKSNQPLSEIVTYETDYKSKSYIKYSKDNTTSNEYAISLKCIASPLALSTNLGVCYVRNDNWDSLSIQAPVTPLTPVTALPPLDVANAIREKNFSTLNDSQPAALVERVALKISKTEDTQLESTFGGGIIAIRKKQYVYDGNLKDDITKIASDLSNAITGVTFSNGVPVLEWYNETQFLSPGTSPATGTVNLLDYFGDVNKLYDQLFKYDYDTTPPDIYKPNTTGIDEDPFKDGVTGSLLSGSPLLTYDNTQKRWTKQEVLDLLKTSLSNAPIQDTLKQNLVAQIPALAEQIAQEASNVSSKFALPFLEVNNSNTKQLGYISNIYVNLNYLYEQAISKNAASNDTQNKNTISIRDYIQSIMRDVQNSLGNVNSFDIQVDNRNAIGRIIDINFTGNPTDKLFTLQLHNLNSVVRDYKFSSKIFPEMGSIIAISAQDATGIGKLGYDNATLVAWNEGIKDRLIPKKSFNKNMILEDPNAPNNPNNPVTFLLPFLTKIHGYFQYVNNNPTTTTGNRDNINYAYGGLDFAYRDFLSNLDRFDPRNQFKTIIPTELTITLDGIGGIIIGNLFKINQDIIPKGYRNVPGRDIAYIVTKLGHQISGNDWTTELSAYPIVFENSTGVNVWKQWNNQQYPGATIINVGGRSILIGGASISNFNQDNIKIAVKFFISKGFSDIQIAALLGGLIQESGLNPEITNSIGAYGIAQWLGERKNLLLAKSNPSSLNTQLNFVIEEFNNNEKAAGNKLKQATTIEAAIAAAAAYERFGIVSDLFTSGQRNINTLTFSDIVGGREIGNRIEFTQELLNNISKYK